MSNTKSSNRTRITKLTMENDDSSLSSVSTGSVAGEEERDEVQEVHKFSQKDTYRVRMWRFVVIGLLVVTAVCVTITTYYFLRQKQTANFKIAFEQFSRTVENAAIQHQEHMREAYAAYANIMTAYVKSNNLTWPFVTLPFYETYARNILKHAGAEVIAMFPFVTKDNQEQYLEYARQNYESWVREGHEIEGKGRLMPQFYHPFFTRPNLAAGKGFIEDVERDFYFPAWQYSPPPASYGLINWNVMSGPDFMLVKSLLELRNQTLVTKVRKYVGVPTAMTEEDHAKLHSKLKNSSKSNPHSFVYHPIHKEIDDYNSEIVAISASGIAWDASLLNLLPQGVKGLHAVIRNNCNQSYTYELDGPDAFFVDEGDHHEAKFTALGRSVDLALHDHPNFTSAPGHCRFSMHVYPTTLFWNEYQTDMPSVFAGIVAITFLLVILVFYVYDMFVQIRNERLVFNNARSNAMISSLFPSNIRDRLMEQKEDEETTTTSYKSFRGRKNLKTFLNDNNGQSTIDSKSKPLADLFLETTVLFADIAGFTAWSSVREPSQVFTLLETVYSYFDRLAKKRRVFKVETVGDCYVAVVGVPDPRADHAVVMVRFARDIMKRMSLLTKELEVTLGPDTGDLSLRIGIHSGPVTGGVLRGDRSRFQLFGDTMNTTARIESTSRSGRIHLSKECAEELINFGKGDWLIKREDIVTAKGKGEMQTYWATLHSDGQRYGSTRSSQSSLAGQQMEASFTPLAASIYEPGLDEKTTRLINWNVEMLLRLLKQVVAHREAPLTTKNGINKQKNRCIDDSILQKGETFLDEVKEIIALPDFDSKVVRNQQNPDQVALEPEVIEQLQHYVSNIAKMYQANPFHNFEHASHVVMSVIKLMSRIVAPDVELDVREDIAHKSKRKKMVAALLHDHTYGITSDPLTQFACAFSALIHDVDHTGVPNTQLIIENPGMGNLYNNRSVAEQNSLDLAWNLLMTERYDELRGALFPSEEALVRFRHLVVNSVMATDIVDKDLKALRNARWDKAFTTTNEDVTEQAALLDAEQTARDDVNRKATIVIEHIIQASDISHTMQHWHIYRKWNEKLFTEMYNAFKAGRAGKDPSEFWYKGEIGFFDFYIIPLAKKLKDCGVFGISSDEYLNYAMKNRQEWEERGEEVVAGMIEKIKKKAEQEESFKIVDGKFEI